MSTITITLADGTTHSLQVRKTLKHWKSALLRQLPYGTDVQGATFTRS
jgi:hypothetical protein